MPKALDFDELNRIAQDATQDVHEAARRTGEKLAVWRDGRVLHVSPGEAASLRVVPDQATDLIAVGEISKFHDLIKA